MVRVQHVLQDVGVKVGPDVAVALLYCCLQGLRPAGICCACSTDTCVVSYGEKRKKTTPFGINRMRSHVIHCAAQVFFPCESTPALLI